MSGTEDKVTVDTLRQMKNSKQKVVMLTAYDYSTAGLVERGGADVILVGDSMGMTVLGHEDTLPVTIEDMISHTAAVCRGVTRPLVVADMPFMSFQVSAESAVRNAGRLMKESGAQAVKLEGGEEVLPQVSALRRAGIPVMGHIGLTPQAVHQLGGFKVQGRDLQAARALLVDAQLLEEAGCFSLVLECIPAEISAEITRVLSIPTIGIGAGPDCDGQVLVFHDLVGMFDDFTPRFVRRYGNAGAVIRDAVREFSADVRNGDFPGSEESFSTDPAVIDKLRGESSPGEEG